MRQKGEKVLFAFGLKQTNFLHVKNVEQAEKFADIRLRLLRSSVGFIIFLYRRCIFQCTVQREI